MEDASLNGWPVWRVGILLSGLICNRSARKGIVARSRSVDEYSIVALFLTYNALLWAMKSSPERERELSYKLLSEARAEKEGYNSLATRRTFSDAVTALYPAIAPYD